MRTDQVTVYFADTNDTVRADVLGPALHGPLTPRQHDAEEDSRRYADIIDPLERRGLECVVDFGLSEYIVHVLLPGGSHLTISPPQERDESHEPEVPDGWLVTRNHPDTNELFEVVYDSEPGGPHVANAGSVPALLAAVSAYLDRLDEPDLQQAKTVRDRAGTLLTQAGFVAVASTDEFSYRLPTAMVEHAERRAAVTQAVDGLRAEGYGFACPADLLDPVLPAVGVHNRSAAARMTAPLVAEANGHRPVPKESVPALVVRPIGPHR